MRDKRWTKCGDSGQPGIVRIATYLQALPWRPYLTASNCEPNRFYMINNTRPGYLSNGSLNASEINAGTAVPPSSLRTIGDALNEQHISWTFYQPDRQSAGRSIADSVVPGGRSRTA